MEHTTNIVHLYNNRICIRGGWLYESNIMTKSNYKLLVHRGIMQVLRRGARNRPALVAWDSVPAKYQKAIIDKIGDPTEVEPHNFLIKHIEHDKQLVKWFADYRYDGDKELATERATEYYYNTIVLRAVLKSVNSIRTKRRAAGGRTAGIWEAVSEAVNALKDRYNHSLPPNPMSLRRKAEKFKKQGINSIIHKNYGNQNSRKVNEDLEHLLLSIYAMPNKPYNSMTLDIYLEFLAGQIDVVDTRTGELFDRKDFYDDKGNPVLISEAAVWQYINKPDNQPILSAMRNDFKAYNDVYRPHHNRHKPKYSLSLISMDDRDLPRPYKIGNKKQTVKAYYAYDVMSTIVVGRAYSQNKDKDLFIGVMRDMFRFLWKEGVGFPFEMEVEHHLVNRFKEDLMKAGVLFPFVRWAVPGNSQEKYSERFNGVKKMGFEKRYQTGIGRFYNKREADRLKDKKTWDETGMKRVETIYKYDDLIADDLWIIEKYNNSPHPDQKTFPGKTRLQVFRENINKELPVYDEALVARYVGNKTETSIRRSQYVQVQYGKYQIPGYEVLSKLHPNKLTVDAYWLEEKLGIEQVYLYQDDTFICKADKIQRYNVARAEQTEKDKELIEAQRAFVKQHDDTVKAGKKKLARVEIIERNPEKEIEIEQQTVRIHQSKAEESAWDDKYIYDKDEALNSL